MTARARACAQVAGTHRWHAPGVSSEMAIAAWHLRDIVRLSRWYLGGGRSLLTAGITSFRYLHQHLPAVVPYADTTMNSWAFPTKFNFVAAAQPQGQAGVGLAGSDSCPSCRPRAWPHRHHRWHSGAEVLALHLSDAFTDSKPAQDSPALTQPAHLGAVHLVQSVAHFLHRRALRRICSDGKANPTRDRCT